MRNNVIFGEQTQINIFPSRTVDDFVIETKQRQVHILNAPSPAATASLAIAKYVVSLTKKLD
jgi:hypothetical protein